MKSPLQAMRDLLSEDRRYKLEAYQFIREALQYAHEHLEEYQLGDECFGDNDSCGEDLGDDSYRAAEMSLSDFDDELLEDDAETSRRNSRHITGQQLCEACRQYAVNQYGYLARMVLGTWGINSTSDFGELVYNLIQIEQMRKSESDRREDFDGVFDFENAFDPDFQLSLESES
jgi:uncharacterized repeat protein (TIGR04138 family)